MPTPTLTAYRAANPGDTRPDSVVIPSLISQLQNEGTLHQFPDLMNMQAQLAQRNSGPEIAQYSDPTAQLARAFLSATYGAEGKMYGTLAQIGAMSGSHSPLKQFALDQYQKKMQEAAQVAPPPANWGSVGGALQGSANFLAGVGPQLGGIMGAGAVGGVAGGLVGGPAGAAVGSILGAGGAAYTQTQNYGELATSGVPDSTALPTSIGVGALGALLQTYVPAKAAQKLFGHSAGEAAANAVNDVLTGAEKALPGLGQYMLKNAAQEGGTAAAANVATELVTMAGDRLAHQNDPNWTPPTSTEVAHRLLEAGASGVILGAGLGAVTSAVDRAKMPALLQKGLALKTAQEARLGALQEDAFNQDQIAQQKAASQYDANNFPIAPATPVAPVEAPVPTPVAPPEPVAPTPIVPAATASDVLGRAPSAFTPLDETPAAAPQEAPPVEPVTPQIAPPPEPIHVTPEPTPELGGTKEVAPAPPPAEVPAPPPVAPLAPTPQTAEEPAPAPIPEAPPVAPTPPTPPTPVPLPVTKPEPAASPTQKNMPEWARQASIAAGVDPNRPFNDFDLANPSIRQAIQSDPTISAVEKSKLLGDQPVVKPIAAPNLDLAKPKPNEMPPLRMAPEGIKPNATAQDLAEAAKLGLRGNERSVNTSKKLMAVLDTQDGATKLLPLYSSTGNEWRVATALEDTATIRKQIGDKMGVHPSDIDVVLQQDSPQGRTMRLMANSLSGLKGTLTFDELLAAKNEKGEQRYKPLYMLNTVEPVRRQLYQFDNFDKFQEAMGIKKDALPAQSALGGQEQSTRTVDKLKALDPDVARGVQQVASIVEAHRNTSSTTVDALRGLLKVPRPEVLLEHLGAAKVPEDLIQKFGPKEGDQYPMGLFKSKEDMEAVFDMMNDPKAYKDAGLGSPDDLPLNILKALAKTAGWESWNDYTIHASRKIEGKQFGEELPDESVPKKEAPKLGSAWDTSKPATLAPNLGKVDLGGMSLDEHNALAQVLRDGLPDHEEQNYNFSEAGSRYDGNTILEARDEAEISSPGEDAEFEDVQHDLREFINYVWRNHPLNKTGDTMDEAQLYKVWANLDRASKDTQPARDDYRQTSTGISNRYRASVSTLLGMGADYNIIESGIDAQAEFLRNEWQRTNLSDTRRTIIAAVHDIMKPTMENLRRTLHETAHVLLADEKPATRQLILDAVDRMGDMKLDVFSKTKDARINGSTPLVGSKLAEEVLAEHLSFFGLKQTAARTLAQRFVGAIKQLYNRALMAYANFRDYALDPKIAQDYMERRMTEFVDKTLNSMADIDVMSGNVPDKADFTATLYKTQDSQYHRYDYEPLTGQMVLRDVVPIGGPEALFNLDNRLMYHDFVAAPPKGWGSVGTGTLDQGPALTVNYFKENFGVDYKPTDVNTMLDRVAEKHGYESGLKYMVDALKQTAPDLLRTATVRFAKSDADFERLSGRYGSDGQIAPGLYAPDTHEILVDPNQVNRYNSLGAANLLLHEALHVTTAGAVDVYNQYKTLGRDIDALRVLHPEMSTGLESMMRKVERMDNIYAHLKDNDFYPGAYGMKNLDEFMAELGSNRMFQIKLSKEELPTKLQLPGAPKTALGTLIHWMGRMLGFEPKKGNAYVESIKALEQVLMSANSTEFAPNFSWGNTRDLAAPISQTESDAKVKTDFEYAHAVQNSWLDVLRRVILPLSSSAKLPPEEYMNQIFGIKNPLGAKTALDTAMQNRPDDTMVKTVNRNLSLDATDPTNKITSTLDRSQIMRAVVGRAEAALQHLDTQHDEYTRSLPILTAKLEDKQAEFSQMDKKMNDWLAARDSVNRALRGQIRNLNQSLGDAVYWSTEQHGLAGVMNDLMGVGKDYAMPADVVNLVKTAVTEAGPTAKLSDLIAAMDQRIANIGGMSAPQIETEVNRQWRATNDPRLAHVIDGSPRAKADLALAIFIAKTEPETALTLGIRGEAPELREILSTEIRNAITNSAASAGDLPSYVSSDRRVRERVAQVRQMMTRARADLNNTKAALDDAKLVTQEVEKAKAAMQAAIDPMETNIGIQARPWQPYHGAPVLLTPDPFGKPEVGKFSMLPKDQSKTYKTIMDNQKWLDQNQGTQGKLWNAINSQVQNMKAVAGSYTQTSFRKSLYSHILGSVSDRWRLLGDRTAKVLGDRVDRYVNASRSQERMSFRGFEVTEALGKAQAAWGFSNKTADGFTRTVYGPLTHFIGHEKLLPGGDEEATAKANARKFFANKPETQQWMRDNPGAFDELWNFHVKNSNAAHDLADFSASNVGKDPVLVRDPSIQIKDPFTGKVSDSYRPAMEVGPLTVQRDTSPLFDFKRFMDGVKDPTGVSVWPQIAAPLSDEEKLQRFNEVRKIKKQNGPDAYIGPNRRMITPDMETALFTPDVKERFVQPYINDVGTTHFPAPRDASGESYNRADPIHVQGAWDAAKGDMEAFSKALYDMEKLPTQSPAGADEYHQDIMHYLVGQYKKFAELTEGQEQFNARGIGGGFIASNMMDSRKAEDLPAEFTKPRIYDHLTMQAMIDNIAAHGTFGRDFGLFDNANDRNKGAAWEINHLQESLQGQLHQLNDAKNTALLRDPRLDPKALEEKLKAQFGEKEYKRLMDLPKAITEANSIETAFYSLFNSHSGSTRAGTFAKELLRTTVDFMLNQPRSVIVKMNDLVQPLQLYGATRTGYRQTGRVLSEFMRSVGGSIAGAFGKQARFASEYGQYTHDVGMGLDRGNFVTPAQIWADTGRNNSYVSKPVLGYIRKGRSIFFDQGFKPTSPEDHIAPAFRPQAIYSMVGLSMDQGTMSAEMQLYDQIFKSAVDHLKSSPQDVGNPDFRFDAEKLNAQQHGLTLTDQNYKYLTRQFGIMGTTLELEAQQLMSQIAQGKDMGDVMVPKYLGPRIASNAETNQMLAADINTVPAWFLNNPVGQMARPLLSWTTIKMNQLVGMARNEDGAHDWSTSKKMMLAMVAGSIPAGILISMMLDEYDENVLGKKSNAIGFNWSDPGQTAAALTERLSRIGTFGLAGDVVNGLRVYGSDGDTRGISIDQRVVFVNSVMEMMSMFNTAVHQHGNLTYDSFWRPLINTVGGGSFLQYGQILNKASVGMGGDPIFQSEYEQTTRLNALNYLRAAGRATGQDVKVGDGGTPMPTPLHPYISQMVLSAYGNDPDGFLEAYQHAVDEAKSEGVDDPEQAIKRHFASYQPLRYVFQSPPTKDQISQLLLAMSDKGRDDVMSALQAYDQYAARLGIPAYTGRETTQPKQVAKTGRGKPSAFAPIF